MTVTIASVVKNAEEFLPRALECWKAVSDRVRIVDNGSTDGTIDILKGAGVEWTSCFTPMEGNEWRVRKALWDYASEDAEWVVHLDHDHVVADDFRPFLLGNAVQFRVYDMWSPTEYRQDAWWRVRPWWKAINVSEFADTRWVWNERGWHSGHLPMNAAVTGRVQTIPVRSSILHYGYATPELRESHHAAYMARSEHLSDSELAHAKTIIDPEPRTVELPFKPRWTLL